MSKRMSTSIAQVGVSAVQGAKIEIGKGSLGRD